MKVICTEKNKVKHWFEAIHKTQLFESSSLRGLGSSPTVKEPVVALQAVILDSPTPIQALRTWLFKQCRAGQDTLVLDLGEQQWSKSDLAELLSWVESSAQTIHILKLGEAALDLEAFAYLVEWQQQTAVNVNEWDLGNMVVTLPRARILAQLCDNMGGKGKINFSQSYWDSTQMKVWLWSCKQGINCNRITLGAMRCPAESIDMLMMHCMLPSSKLEVFSTGTTLLSERALGSLLAGIRDKAVTIQACVLCRQHFSKNNSALLLDVLLNSGSLQRVALMECLLDTYDWPEASAAKAKVKKVYLETDIEYSKDDTLKKLISLGYKEERKLTEHKVWLTQ